MTHSPVPGERVAGYDVSDRLDTDYYEVFADVTAHEVTFANPLTGGTSSNTVYVANTTPGRRPAD